MFKNLFLLSWASFLLCVGVFAVRGEASSFILGPSFLNSKIFENRNSERFGNSNSKKSENKDAGIEKLSSSENTIEVQESVRQDSALSEGTDLQNSSEVVPLDTSSLLEGYLQERYFETKDSELIPPVPVVLDRLQINLSWRNPVDIDNKNGINPAPNASDYEDYFKMVTDRLEAIANFAPNEDAGEILKIRNDFVPPIFRSQEQGKEFKEIDIDLPLEAVFWIRQKQLFDVREREQLSLLDTFILLIILGGFGSWIYLVRLHLEPEERDKLELTAYFYRPLLGMTLALAVFIVDVSLHSAVSTAEIGQIRRETLILLAFGAGLLSEKAYRYIERITGKSFEETEEGKQREEEELRKKITKKITSLINKLDQEGQERPRNCAQEIENKINKLQLNYLRFLDGKLEELASLEDSQIIENKLVKVNDVL